MTNAARRVSVIVPAYHSDGTIEAFLQALERQRFRDFEVIVVDSSEDDRTAELVRARSPETRFERSPRRLLPHAARNRGVELAGGELFAFTDPDCVPRSDWLDTLVGAHDAGHPVVGGSIELHGGSGLEAGIHWCKFAWWMAGGAPSPRPDLATANLLYSRSVWDEVGPFPTDRFCGDSVINRRAKARGHQLWFEPAAIVEHTHTSSLGEFWRERVARGKDFGADRARSLGWSRLRVAAHLAAMPAIPLVQLWRAGVYARQGGRFRSYLAHLPLQLLGHTGWAVGEAAAHRDLLLGANRG